MKKVFFLLFLGLALIPSAVLAQSAMKGLHGDDKEIKSGLHAGNQFRTTFYNDGTYGINQRPPDIAGEWPINSGHWYMMDGNVFVCSEVFNTKGELKHLSSTVRSGGASASWGDHGPNNEWWTFLPLPGFANPDSQKIAMSKWPDAWPLSWPDKSDDAVDPGWAGKWNGYFGKNIFNADEESYFVADDYADAEESFYPDSTDLDRRGLGLRMYVRGFQWSNALVEDALFVLFDLENIGTHEHDKMVFGYKFGNNMGDAGTSWDANDDCGAYDKDQDVAYLYDDDDRGAGGWSPVGYFGGTFMESPGNPYDGIDNDGDAVSGSGKIITESLFAPRKLDPGISIIIINYKTFTREPRTMPDQPFTIQYLDQVLEFTPGMTVVEKQNNLIDDNLNGLIDENNGSTFGAPPNEITKYLFTGLKYIDYFDNTGKDNPLIEERRDDGIDNDGDWDILTDDLGADGRAFTMDPGEKDGIPTFGEPHFDKTDIDETDMIGLTSFTLYSWLDIPHYEEETVWTNLVPGFLDDQMQNDNVELLYGSGYFPMKPGQMERFSMGILCGYTLDEFLENKYWVAKAYNENYNFSKAPNIPTVTAVPGDNRVTLYWDDFAEESDDPISGKDFEGYRIYRSTAPAFTDTKAITDGMGSVTYREPLAQFDIDNEYSGYAAVPLKGTHFWLGTNTGLVHSWTDTTAVNGQKYYYAVVSYDRGFPDGDVAPTECSKFISVATSGAVDKGSNIAIVRPGAPTAGYHSAELKDLTHIQGLGTGMPGYEIINPILIKDGHKYEVTFEDTVTAIATRLYSATKTVTLKDITDSNNLVTLIDKSRTVMGKDALMPKDGFLLILNNDSPLSANPALTSWNRSGVYGYVFQAFKSELVSGVGAACDYQIEFGSAGVGTSTALQISSTETLPAVPVNFTVKNLTTNEAVAFAFYEKDVLTGEQNTFSAFSAGDASDVIIFLEKDKTDALAATWSFELDPVTKDAQHGNPAAGDHIVIKTRKPFSSSDKFEFTTHTDYVDNSKVKSEMSLIKVVPNPYVVTNSWEPLNPYSNGRGPRELHFNHLPATCTIRIFNIRGLLVQTLEHRSEIDDGTEIWDLQSRDNLDISYGVYVYHVDAGSLGQITGKFAVIK